MAEKKISQATLKKSFRNWAYGNLTCFSQEHMQTFGYLAAMLPVVDELYDNDEDKVNSLRTYTTFFNTEPQIGTLLDDETINGIRAGLMGPLAGLGDSIIVGTFIPILLGIALGLSTGGSVLGPLFYIVAWNVAMYFGMKYAYNQGYTMGGAAVEALVGPQSAALRSSIVMVGTMVIGAVAATWINITTALQVTFTKDSAFVLQDTLDGIFPKALNFFFVWLCWWLMTKKKISPTVVMLILVGIAFVGVLVGFFDPKLKY